MPLPHQCIRNDFVIDFLNRRDAVLTRQWQLIEERDAKGRALNEKYRHREPDGSVSAYIRSHVDAPYVAEFERVEAWFQPFYDELSATNAAQNRRAGMTVYEYLLLDEVRDKDRYLAAAKEQGFYDWIGLMARIEIDNIKHNTFSDMQRLITMKKQHFGYARKRCRDFLEIKPWDVGAQAAMMSFSSEFDRNLKQIAGNLRAG